ncbi:MAG TPA: type I secretion system permease/ATPase [Beijerinckiaceae bacterium]|jgi:ATP-binding cassette subfamily C protein
MKGRGSTELAAALRSCRLAFLGVGLMTAVINVLYLTGSFYMLEVYDRVLPSRSIPTLVGLSVIALALYAFQGALEMLRGRVLVRIGAWLDERLSGRVFDVVVRLPLKTRAGGDGLLPLRDLDTVRGFLSGLGPPALFDLPWMPLYLAICFLFHFYIGLAALVGCVILVILTILTDVLTRGPTKSAIEQGMARNGLAEAGRRNAEVLHALGMSGRMGQRWGEANQRYQDSQQRVADVAGGLGAASKVTRMALQSVVLAIGAYLVVHGDASGGIMIAAGILSSRALAPVELAIGQWKGFVAARQSWRRLSDLLAAVPEQDDPLPLPKPTKSFTVEGVTASPPGQQRIIVQDVTFGLRAGQALGVIGPSASGKSSLVRILTGVWTPLRGRVRLDGAALDQWSPDMLGRHIGYLPQDVELFAGTVAQNIARFEPDATSEAVIAAAQAAGVHDLILRLPEGYDTQIGESGGALSVGQRQRVALARALYGDPFLIILDEPNSNLDAEGEGALTQAILGAKERGAVVIVVAHRPSALAAVDLVLVMEGGKAQAFGPRDKVMAQLVRPAGTPPAARQAGAMSATAAPAGAPLRVVADAQGTVAQGAAS